MDTYYCFYISWILIHFITSNIALTYLLFKTCFLSIAGSCGLSSSLDDEVGFPADIKLESTNDCMPDEDKDFKVCVVCGEKASGFYFGALVCLPCKVSFIGEIYE